MLEGGYRTLGGRGSIPGRQEGGIRLNLFMAQKLLNYEVIEKLGEGAGSVIYAVSDPVTKQLYALKHVVRTDPKDIRFVEQMEQEFEISRQFVHPNLRRTFDLKINKSMLVKV